MTGRLTTIVVVAALASTSIAVGGAPASGAAGTRSASMGAHTRCAKKQLRSRATCRRVRASAGLRRVAGSGRALLAPRTGRPTATAIAAGGPAAPVEPGQPAAAPGGGGGGGGPTVGPVDPAPVASTVGADAYDFGSFVLRVTRPSVPAGQLTIYFRNHDVSDHNLWIESAGGAPTLVSEAVGENGGATKTVTVTPGSWRLYCSLDGHESMTRGLAVT